MAVWPFQPLRLLGYVNGPGRSGRASFELTAANEDACGGVGDSYDRERPVVEGNVSIRCSRVNLQRPRVGAVFRPAGRVFVNEENGNAGLFSRSFRFRMTFPSVGKEVPSQTRV